MTAREIKPADGKMLVFFVGMGAITSTVLTGIFNIRKGLHKPIGSLTQMGHIRLGKRTENRSPLIKEFVPLADINDLEFAGWDIFNDNMYESAKHAAVVRSEDLEPVRDEMIAIKIIQQVADQLLVMIITIHAVAILMIIYEMKYTASVTAFHMAMIIIQLQLEMKLLTCLELKLKMIIIRRQDQIMAARRDN